MAKAAEPVRRGFSIAEEHHLLVCDVAASPMLDWRATDDRAGARTISEDCWQSRKCRVMYEAAFSELKTRMQGGYRLRHLFHGVLL